jgi:hypothetical protein
MSLPRPNDATPIADQLNALAAKVKARSRASLTDANRLLETIATHFFNALFGWDLVNLNTKLANCPAADLGDRPRRIAIQVTNEDSSDKTKHPAANAVEHRLATDFDRLIVFFLLPRKPRLPKRFTQSSGGHSRSWGDNAPHEVHVFNDEGCEVPGSKAPTVMRDGQSFTELRLGEDRSAATVKK